MSFLKEICLTWLPFFVHGGLCKRSSELHSSVSQMEVTKNVQFHNFVLIHTCLVLDKNSFSKHFSFSKSLAIMRSAPYLAFSNVIITTVYLFLLCFEKASIPSSGFCYSKQTFTVSVFCWLSAGQGLAPWWKPLHWRWLYHQCQVETKWAS